jgi:serine protease inhibitor
MKREMLSISVLLFMLVALFSLSGCSEDDEEGFEAAPELITGSRGFGFGLLYELYQEEGGENIFISPLSVSLALAMTYNGAAGETQKAMAKTLDLTGMSLEEVNFGYADLQEKLLSSDPEVEIAIANSLWAREGREFYDDFMERNRRFYDAEVDTLDFGDPQSVAIINDWVNAKTKGKIPQLLDRISPNVALILINATYFKGTWKQEFDPFMTQDRPFHLLNGSEKQVPMMNQFGVHAYITGESFAAVRLPYGSDRICMYIFLPDRDSSIQEFLEYLNSTNWEKWMKALEKEIEIAPYGAGVQILLPRFKLEYEVELADALSALGMGVAFGGGADFSKMGPPPKLWIDEAIHKTFVEVNEEGTEAAAVTGIIVPDSIDWEPPAPFIFMVDRPFLLAIRDDVTGAVLFIGVIMEPM